MSSDKYIGLDVHQSTVSIAVLDSGGKLVMESIIETKAETILQFFHGLRGNLSVTFEEGTCAAWLYDLLKPPRVNRVVVCNPRKSALLKSGNKSDRIDARKLAETPTHRPSLARLPWRDRRAHLEGAGLQLSNDHQRSHASHESPQGSVSELGHSLCRSASLCTAPSCRVAQKVIGSRRPPSGGASLPTTRRAAISAPRGAAGGVSAEPGTPCD